MRIIYEEDGAAGPQVPRPGIPVKYHAGSAQWMFASDIGGPGGDASSVVKFSVHEWMKNTLGHFVRKDLGAFLDNHAAVLTEDQRGITRQQLVLALGTRLSVLLEEKLVLASGQDLKPGIRDALMAFCERRALHDSINNLLQQVFFSPTSGISAMAYLNGIQALLCEELTVLLKPELSAFARNTERPLLSAPQLLADADVRESVNKAKSGLEAFRSADIRDVTSWMLTSDEVIQKGRDTRLRQLSEKSRLTEFIDAAEVFFKSMVQLQAQSGLPTEKWQPLLHSLTEYPEANAGQRWSVRFIDITQPEHRVIHYFADETVGKFVKDYDRMLTDISTVYGYGENRLIARQGISNTEAIHGLNAAFLVKTLIPWFASKSRMAVATDTQTSRTLNTALQVHTWINLSQMSQGVLEDGGKFIALCREISGSVTSGSVLTRGLSYASGAAGIALNAASMVLDSIELAHAQNESQRAVSGTQLAFDSTGFATSVVGLGAGMVGATSVVTAVGGAGVILAGLGIGVTALAETFGQIAGDAQAVGSYFADLDAAWLQGGYRAVRRRDAQGNDHVLMEPMPGAVISVLDLKNRQLTFDSPRLYRSTEATLGSGYRNWVSALPQAIVDKSQAINVRERLGYRAMVPLRLEPGYSLLLPLTPGHYLNYEYEILPGATSRHDRGFDVLRRLEADRRFHYDFYTFPSEYLVHRIAPEYVPTPVSVILDFRDRDILVPSLPGEFKGKLSYQLTGNGGTQRVSLQEGVALSLQGNSETRWVLDARQLYSDTLHLDGNRLQVGEVYITLPADACGAITVITRNHEVFMVDRKSQRFISQEVDGSRFHDLQALHTELKRLVPDFFHDSPFVTVDNYQPSAQTGSVGRAFYQRSTDSFIYTNLPGRHDFLSRAVLAGVDGDRAWFYCDASVWQVSVPGGDITAQYLLSFTHGNQQKIIRHTTGSDGMLYLTVQQQDGQSGVLYTYRIEDGESRLIAVQVSGRVQRALLNYLEPDTYPGTGGLLSPSVHAITSRLADMVTLTDNSDNASLQDRRFWVFFDEYQQPVRMVRANFGHKPQPEDLDLTFVTTDSEPGYWFYSLQAQSVYFQADGGLSGRQQIKTVMNNVRTLFMQGQQRLVCTLEDTLWLMDNGGTALLVGVTAQWLRKHRQDLRARLLAGLVRDNADSPFLLLQGIKSRENKAIPAWYDSLSNRFIVGGTNLDTTHNLVYLGLNPDGRTAWIFDADSGQLYRQPLSASLLPVFDENLILIEQIRDAEPWLLPGDQKISTAVRQGDRLRVETREGAVLVLPMTAGRADKPILVAFHGAKRQDADIISALAVLVPECETPQAVRLTAVSGQAPRLVSHAGKKDPACAQTEYR